MNKPLNIVIQEARNMIVSDINKTISKTGIPPYLLELILTSVLADIREQKSAEIMIDCNRIINATHAELEALKAKEADKETDKEADTEEKEGAE